MSKEKFFKGSSKISLSYKELRMVVKKKNGRFKIRTNIPVNNAVISRLLNSYFLGVSYEDYREMCIKKVVKNLKK